MDEVRAAESAAADDFGVWFEELDVPEDIDWTAEPSQRMNRPGCRGGSEFPRG